jgi:hypothetical protein
MQNQFVGYFDDAEEAARAYDRAVLAWRGDSAVTNFPYQQYKDTAVAPASDQSPPQRPDLPVPQQVWFSSQPFCHSTARPLVLGRG